ncbi:MAG: hypothetical protein M1816_003250 [Peltula sp. TS41687]|nr:MAG: hypothetical protein M1816_003250 [Peltula sp. TS41687]
MNVNRKLDRLKQWAGERMGGEVKTNVSDEFRALEEEMTYRHEGMERLHKSMTSYVKSISKTKEAEEKDRSLPVAYLGATMISHGQQLDRGSVLGSCLIDMGRTNERIGRTQENYIGKATSSWLESLERSLVQMKEYQAARKKLEARRLAYDASLSKMQKAKKEDFRVEEELRAQKAKYEESNEDVYRRMQDIKEAESESLADLEVFLEAELEYHERCQQMLLKLKREWPAARATAGNLNYDRTEPGYGCTTPYDSPAEQMTPKPRPSIRSTKTAPVLRDPSRSDVGANISPMSRGKRIPTDPASLTYSQSRLRQVDRINTNREHFPPDASDDSAFTNSSPERSCDELPESPTTSYGSVSSRFGSSITLHSGVAPNTAKKIAPPPPPSRSKKPPPPPPPMKRSTLSTTSVPYA